MNEPSQIMVSTSRSVFPLQPSPEACQLVVFGATGDLMHRKLMPAVYNLAHDGLLPEGLAVVGVGRRETFLAIKLFVDNWRWAGVPFYVRTGKRLARRLSQIVIQFRCAPSVLFSKDHAQAITPNTLVLQIQPDEGISLQFNTKVPGTLTRVHGVDMDYSFGEDFGSYSSEAYERLLLDALNGDTTLFSRRDEVEAAWSIVDPIRSLWQSLSPPEPYAAGFWGPASSETLLEADGRQWWNIPRKLHH